MCQTRRKGRLAVAQVVLDSWTALGILLKGAGIGALLTKILFSGRMRQLRAEIETHFSTVQKSSRNDDVHLSGDDETISSKIGRALLDRDDSC